MATVRVNIPVRVEASADLLRADASAELVARVAAAVKQSLEYMADELAADGHAHEPVIHDATLHWTGPALSLVPATDRAVTGGRLLHAVRQVSQAFESHARARNPVTEPAGVELDHPIKFHTTPRRFFELLLERRGERRDHETRYLDRLDLPHDGVVFRVQTRGTMSLDDLHQVLARALDRQLHGEPHDYFVAITRQDVSKIVGLALHDLADLATAYVSSPTTTDGVVWIAPSSQLYVAALRLPPVEVDTVTARGQAAHRTIALRELEPYIVIKPFREVTSVTWESYRAEWGEDPIAVTIYPFAVRRRTHGRTLEALFAEQSRHEGNDGLQLGGLALLTRAATNLVPALQLSAFSDDVTRALPGAKADGPWEVGWRGAYVSAWLPANGFKVAAARHRPAARALARQIIDVLSKRDPAHHELRHLLVSAYGESSAAIERSAEAFEFLLEVLDNLPEQPWITRLYDASRHHDSQELLVQLAHGTRYANHPAVRNAAARVAAGHAKASIHFYVPGIGVRIHRSWTLRYNEVLGARNELYLIKSTRSRIKKSSEPKISGWFQTACRLVVERMVANENASHGSAPSSGLTGGELMRAILHEMEKLVARDDIEEVEVQRSIRLLGVRAIDDHGVVRHRVRFSWVERVPADATAQDDGWATLQDPSGNESIEELDAQAFGGFDELLFRWEFSQSAIVAEVEVKLVGFAIAVFGAVELGALALAPHALSFIGFNLAIYVIKAAFFGGEFTIDGLILEVVKGYAMALGFGFFAPIGKAAGLVVARLFTVRGVAGTLAKVLLSVAGYASQRIVSGSITGAGAAAVTQLATDLVLIAMGVKPGFSSWDDYLKSMGWGALLGIVFEVGGDGLRLLGKLDSLQSVAAALKRARWSPAKWWIELDKARAAMNDWMLELTAKLNVYSTRELIEAFGRAFTELKEAALDATQRALLRRIIEISKTELTPLANVGLERLLDSLKGDAADSLLHALASQPRGATWFLELLGELPGRRLAVLAEQGQLAELASSTRVLALLRFRQTAGLGLLEAFGNDVAAAEGFLVELAALPAAAYDQGLQLFGRSRLQPELVLRALRYPGLRQPDLGELLDLLSDAHLSNSVVLDDLLAALEHIDAAQLAKLTASRLRELARAPQLLDVLRRTPSLGWRLLNDVFGGAIAKCEAYVARLIQASEQHLENIANILLRASNALPRDVVANIVLKYGPLPQSQIALLDRLDANRVNIDGFLRPDTPLPAYEQQFNEYSREEQELALTKGDSGRRPNAVLKAMKAARKQRDAAAAKAAKPPQSNDWTHGLDDAQVAHVLQELGAKLLSRVATGAEAFTGPELVEVANSLSRLRRIPNVSGVDDWVKFEEAYSAKHMRDAAGELRSVERRAAENPRHSFELGQDPSTSSRPGTNDRMRSFDIVERLGTDIVRSIEITSISATVREPADLTGGVKHATAKTLSRLADNSPIPGKELEVEIRVTLFQGEWRSGPNTATYDGSGNYTYKINHGSRTPKEWGGNPNPGNIFVDFAKQLPGIAGSNTLDVVVFADGSGKVIATLRREEDVWIFKS